MEAILRQAQDEGNGWGHNPSTTFPLILSPSKDESDKEKADKAILRQPQDECVGVVTVPQPLPLIPGLSKDEATGSVSC
jgi:hypothetical protein